ncbi:DedA family protein [Bacillus paralicheniformis]|jgi:membrane protein DedA with SNARE-associated domain|uniref:DedA family protein n=1 Tax=Bacillus paralicheniformis TaxID=1648923 RepID=A0AAW6KH72_9BACI|nr:MULTISPECIES: DedA family protein [Bacillus]ETB70978.1 membrane protein [Bacillus sp. CPSM8]KUL12420.1 membrane protein [Bacillus licheniformis LMG 7559]KUL18475.1 membrane protein [Bacillus licheniformis LMG 6934]POO83298.1 DedA family protein [Bacillus sp. MBGLi97]AGN35784.1 putative integral inner membrane protein YngC [Bacillus paralicheniformis ATCC 9945a]
MGSIVNDILMWLTDLGYFGIAIGLMIEIIPSEIVLAYGGYLVSSGSITMTGAVIAGVIGGTIAQLFLYWIGYYGGRPFLYKYGKYLLIQKHHIQTAEKWFEKYGGGVVFSARFIPVVRHAISIPAGIAKMPILKFTGLTVLAIIPWSILFVYLGIQLGSRWDHVENVARTYTTPIMIGAAAMIILYFGLKKLRKK